MTFGVAVEDELELFGAVGGGAGGGAGGDVVIVGVVGVFFGVAFFGVVS